MFFDSFTLFLYRAALAASKNFGRSGRVAGYAKVGWADGCARVVRGGSWNNDNPDNLSCAYRNNNHPDNRDNNIGFRCVVVGESARRCFRKRNRLAWCWPGARPCQSEPRSHLIRPAKPRRSRGKDAARAVAGRPRAESYGP